MFTSASVMSFWAAANRPCQRRVQSLDISATILCVSHVAADVQEYASASKKRHPWHRTR